MAAQLPVAHPKTVLRGHQAQVHAAAFVMDNCRLATGDADGFIVLWDLTIMRPRAVWQAHTNAILGIASWGANRIITHGRDNRLVVWQISAHDEASLSSTPPLDPSPPARPQPWILHILPVNTMNFCSFACCTEQPGAGPELEDGQDLLVAVPNTLASESVDVYHLSIQKRRHTVHLAGKASKNGMVMALSIFWHDTSLTLVAAYENGAAFVAKARDTDAWHVVYAAQSHTQPILSLDVAPSKEYFITSGADAILAKHPIPGNSTSASASAGSFRREKPNEKGRDDTTESSSTNATASSLSAQLAATPGNNEAVPASLEDDRQTMITLPLKTVNTKHSGQQSVQIRSDGKIFATAGWDSRIRVYSTKTLAELAVLKWHEVGCYAVAFAAVARNDGTQKDGPTAAEQRSPRERSPGDAVTAAPASATPGGLSVKERRIKLAKEAHWLAAGSKDGKISLWDIY